MKNKKNETKVTVRNYLKDECKEGRVISVVKGISVPHRARIVKRFCAKESPLEFRESATFKFICDNHNHSLRLSVSPALKDLNKWTWIKLPNRGEFTFQVIQKPETREDIKMKASCWGIIISIPPRYPDWYVELVFPNRKEMGHFCSLAEKGMAIESGGLEGFKPDQDEGSGNPGGNPNNPKGGDDDPGNVIIYGADGNVTPGPDWPPKQDG
jgi:hypothetical protein